MPTAARGYSDAPRITVNELLKDPLVIPALILDMTQNEFVMDSVLRSGGAAPSGAVRYSESTPIVPTSIGIPRVVFSHERAMAIMVSDEMRRRQAVDPVTRQLMQVKNTMVYSWNTAFYSAVVANASIQTLAVGNAWSSAAATIRADLTQAIYLIENASITSPSGVVQWLGFEADTLIINHGTKNTLLQSSTFAAPYIGDIASENLLYTGKLPQQILNLDVLVSRQVPAGNAIVMQRQRAGFYADELPYVAGPLYRDEPRKTWRSDTQRASAIGLDQPLAICLLSGV
jgi:hypothetical protein